MTLEHTAEDHRSRHVRHVHLEVGDAGAAGSQLQLGFELLRCPACYRRRSCGDATSPQRPSTPGSTTDADVIDRFVREYAGALGLDRGYSAHSMHATSITTALENGARLRMCRRPPGTAIRARQSCMIGQGTIPRKPRRFFDLLI
ncbi:MAG TPA: hypothetical protein VKG22_02010 [Stellaceae bacterium]|nr:hypothetical protein [Stellaceae bacterium]